MLQSYPILHFDLVPTVLAIAALIVIIALAFGLAAVLFGSQSGFFDNQDVRGLQVEAVGGMPWYARETVTGKPPPVVDRDGTQEIASGAADAVGTVLKWLGLLVLIAAALWWLARERAIRRGRLDLAEAAVSRDFVFAIILLVITAGLYQAPADMIIRNMALVVAGVDAAIAMFGLLKGRSVCGRYTTPTRRSMRIA